MPSNFIWQIVEAVPSTVRSDADVHHLAQFFSARLADR